MNGLIKWKMHSHKMFLMGIGEEDNDLGEGGLKMRSIMGMVLMMKMTMIQPIAIGVMESDLEELGIEKIRT